LAAKSGRNNFIDIVNRISSKVQKQAQQEFTNKLSSLTDTYTKDQLQGLLSRNSIDLSGLDTTQIQALSNNLRSLKDSIDSSTIDSSLKTDLKKIVDDQIDTYETAAANPYVSRTRSLPSDIGNNSTSNTTAKESETPEIDIKKTIDDNIELIMNRSGMDVIPESQKSNIKKIIQQKFGDRTINQIDFVQVRRETESLLDGEIRALEESAARKRKEGKIVEADSEERKAKTVGRVKQVLTSLGNFCLGKNTKSGFFGNIGKGTSIIGCGIGFMLIAGIVDALLISGALDYGDRTLKDYLCAIPKWTGLGDEWLEDKGWCKGEGLDNGEYKNVKDDFNRWLKSQDPKWVGTWDPVYPEVKDNSGSPQLYEFKDGKWVLIK
jgi:hypothetical protein